jgi:hypothetical protein
LKAPFQIAVRFFSEDNSALTSSQLASAFEATMHQYNLLLLLFLLAFMAEKC